MRSFLLFSLTHLLIFFFHGLKAEKRPNVVVFFVDDLGWTDLGYAGSDFYETPHIDRLAADGLRFTQAYSACTVCSPSRAALLTGQYPARLHLTDFIPGHPIQNTPLCMPDWTQRLNLEEVTIAELLQEAGYHTAHLGKWHLTPRVRTAESNNAGDFPEFYPDRQGFDYNIGGCEYGAPGSYFWPYGRGPTIEARKNNNIFKTLPPSGHGEGAYLTDHLADEAVRLVKQFDDDPFFIYFSFYNVHTPLQARPDLLKKYQAKLKKHSGIRHDNPVYAAMIESVDEAVGRVLRQLEEQGVSERTLVIFSSDNGGLRPQATTNLPARQGKGSIYEGGTRVPAILKFPGRIEPGGLSEEPVITMDFFPAILEVTGVPLPPSLENKVDGRSLVPLMENPRYGRLNRDALFWHYPHYHMGGAIPYSAVRMGDWKLIQRHHGSLPELYDLSADIHEDSNLALLEPVRTAEMMKRLKDWRTSVGAQMPTVNPGYDPDRPTGWKRPDNFREPAATRE